MAAVAERRASSVPFSSSVGDVPNPNFVPCTAARSRTSVLSLSRWAPRYFARALASPKLSVKSRSTKDTSIPAPVTPRCIASHSSSLKSAFVAIRPLLGCVWRDPTQPGRLERTVVAEEIPDPRPQLVAELEHCAEPLLHQDALVRAGLMPWGPAIDG